jgi:hypothetical protein
MGAAGPYARRSSFEGELNGRPSARFARRYCILGKDYFVAGGLRVLRVPIRSGVRNVSV